MRVLLDNNINKRFATLVDGHEVTHVHDIGWGDLQNGDLIAAAEQVGYEVMITADKRMQYQQNPKGRRISILVLNSRFITYAAIAPLAPKVMAALQNLPSGSFITIESDESIL